MSDVTWGSGDVIRCRPSLGRARPNLISRKKTNPEFCLLCTPSPTSPPPLGDNLTLTPRRLFVELAFKCANSKSGAFNPFRLRSVDKIDTHKIQN